MILKLNEIERLAKLARINLTEAEKKKFGKQISSVLEYVEQIKEVDTSKVKEKSHLKDLDNVFREDKILESTESKNSIEQFPDKAGNLNKVKAVME
ncbi:MAG: Asp-tRNA(Asn)/Glu-tRNA(Gln) amidotransferase subunit GatC [Candidatus Kerfeldbacteria bacterium]